MTTTVTETQVVTVSDTAIQVVTVGIQGPAGGGGVGTVTSVAMAVPTGLLVGGSPVTSSGTLALTLASGYVIPQQATLDGFLTTSAAAAAYQPLSAVLTNTTASFTTADETKLDGIEAGAQVNTVTATSSTTFTNKSGNISQWTNDSGYLTASTTTTNISEGTNLYYTDERVDDRVSSLLVAGTNITLTYNDAAGTLTIDSSGGGGGAPTGAEYVVLSANGSLTNERVLTAGTGISLTDAGAGNTVTIASTITQYTDELAQDAVGSILVDSSEIDFTYSDGTPSITASLVAGSIDETKLDASVNASLDKADSALQSIAAAITCVFDGMGSTIAANSKVYLEVPFAMTITGWTIIADQTGSCVIDVWKDTYANYPPVVGDSIAGSEKPTLSAAAKNQDLTLTTWTTLSVAAGDTLVFNVDSATTVQKVTVVLRGTRAA